jgi:hypothetical protein
MQPPNKREAFKPSEKNLDLQSMVPSFVIKMVDSKRKTNELGLINNKLHPTHKTVL